MLQAVPVQQVYKVTLYLPRLIKYNGTNILLTAPPSSNSELEECMVKEYKVITVKSPEDAEKDMNAHALEGWEVKAVTFWETAMSYRLVITLERDRRN